MNTPNEIKRMLVNLAAADMLPQDLTLLDTTIFKLPIMFTLMSRVITDLKNEEEAMRILVEASNNNPYSNLNDVLEGRVWEPLNEMTVGEFLEFINPEI